MGVTVTRRHTYCPGRDGQCCFPTFYVAGFLTRHTSQDTRAGPGMGIEFHEWPPGAFEQVTVKATKKPDRWIDDQADERQKTP